MKKIMLYIFTFYIIYTPNITALTNINIMGIELSKYTILSIGIIFISIYYMNIRIKKKKKIKIHTLISLFAGIFLSSMYYFVRVMSKEPLTIENSRIIQNNFIILHVLYIIIILDILKTWNYNREDMMKFIFNVAMIQVLICILMLMIPEIRQLALNLYYNGKEENIYISTSRIYGISEDYTFGTQIFHAMLAVIALIYGIYKNKKYYLYVPFFLLISLLNGRTGTLIFIINIVIILGILLIKGKINKKIISYLILGTLLLIITLQIIKIAIPKTYSFILSGVEDTINLFSKEKLTGNYKDLFGDMLYWPKGIYFIIGEGVRVYTNSNYPHSDIGYVNDMFMGGIIYISILYMSSIKYILKKPKEKDYNQKIINKLISIISITTLLIANYKGETMKGRNFTIKCNYN